MVSLISNTICVPQKKEIKHITGQCLSRPVNNNKKAIITKCDGSDGQQWVLDKTEDITEPNNDINDKSL